MSEKYKGQEHAKFFRQLTNGFTSAIRREEHFRKTTKDEKGLIELNKELMPAFRGSAIVTFIANVEHLVGKKADGKTWDIPDEWYGKEELKIWRIIRHCWAHAAGRVLPNRRSELENYLRKLKNNEFVDRKGQIVKSFFSIENDRVIVNSLERARLLCTELLAEKGLVEKWPNY